MVENTKFSSDVVVFEDINACNAKLCEEINNYSHEIFVLGLDCEWVNQERQGESQASPVALLQLAFPSGCCLLIRLFKMEAKLPDKLRDILEDRNILKTGVGISEDIKKLNSCYGLIMQGCVDLRHVALRCRGYVGHCISESGTREGMSLSALSQQILGITMDKDWKIRCSDWEAPQLSQRQIEYAANDAIVAIQIFFKLTASRLRERESRIEAAKDHNDEDFAPQTVNASSENEKNFQSSDVTCGIPCQTAERSGNIVVNNLKEVASKNNPDKATNFVSERCCNTQSSNINSFGLQIASASLCPKSQGLLKNSDTDNNSACSSEEGILSSLVTKIKNSFSSVLGVPSEPSEAQKEPSSKHKTKNYAQYKSFKTLELNEDLFSSPEFWSCVTPLCHGIVDVPYKIKAKHKGGGKPQSSEKGQPGLSKASNKASGLKPRRAPLYQNCVIEAPDGEMLSTCDKRKAEWYLCRNLAEVVKEEPYTIRLNFEPSGRPFDPEHNYYLTFKENLCVVCGRDDSYMRKNIIPHDYRKHFPVCMKDHHSHDVLLLCPSCHMISTNHDDLLRRQLAEKYEAPLASAQVARLVQDPELKKVKCAAKALVYAGEKIPEARRNELLSTVKDYFKDDNPTQEMLREAANLETRRENCDFVSHGRQVVRKVREGGELLAFERMWREHFLETMKPKYLPPLWTVDHEQKKVGKLLEKELQLVE